MDDIWLFGYDPAAVLEGKAVAEQAREVEHSAVDDALAGDPDFGPLEALIDKIIDKPEKASRTSMKFAAVRMRTDLPPRPETVITAQQR